MRRQAGPFQAGTSPALYQEVKPVTAVSLILLLLVAIVVIRVLQDQSLQDWLGDQTTALVKPAINQVLVLVNAPPFTYIMASVIFLSAVGLCVLYWRRRVVPQRRVLKEVSEKLQELRISGKAGARTWSDLSTQLGVAMAASPALLSAWNLHVSALTTGAGRTNGSFSDAAENELSRRDRNEAGLMSALPGYYTTIGLILTFVGLVVALYFAARGFRSGNIDEARAAIIQLLNASAFKFLTSVSALAGALLISLSTRAMTSSLRLLAATTATQVDDLLAQWQLMQGAVVVPADGMDVTQASLLAAIQMLSQDVSRLASAVDRIGATQVASATPHKA
jgi:hypothetical protein